jgi:hypothetical protein
MILFITGFTLVYSGFKALDPRCLLQKTFDPSRVCERIDATETNPVTTAISTLPGGTTTQGSGLGSPKGATFNDNNSVVNFAKATAAAALVQARFPTARNAGICNCRFQRGTGSDPTQWSVHSVCGAVDFFTTDPNGMIAYAKSLPMVWDAWLDASPGDVHIQVIPNPPHGWIPPCAGTGSHGGKQPA